MDNDRAKIILSAYRSDGADARDPVFAEALAQAQRDPELARWFAEERSLDERMHAALQEVRPPASLKDSLLLSGKLSKLPGARPVWRQPVWLAVAASIVLLLGLGISALRSAARPATLTGVTSEIAGMHREMRISIDWMTSNNAEIRRWLNDHDAPHDFTVPAKLASQQVLGCQVLDIKGNKVSLICFKVGGGQIAHLFVVDRNRLADAPVIGEPVYLQNGGLSFTSWSHANRTYILASQLGADELRKLL